MLPSSVKSAKHVVEEMLRSEQSIMKIVSYSVDEVDANGWHSTLGQYADASIMQSWSYASARWPHTSLSHLSVTRAGKPAAAAQVVLRRFPVIGGGLAYAHFGPVWRARNQHCDPENLKLALRCLINEYVHKRGMLLRVRPWSSGSPDVVTPTFEAAGFNRQISQFPDRFLVDLSLSEDELRTGLHGKWRYNLKRALRHDLSIVQLDSKEGLGTFMQLYGEMSSRKRFLDTSAFAELPRIHQDLPDGLKPDIWMCFRDTQPVAGAVVSVLGDSAEYLFGASSNESLEVNAGYLLHWTIAMELKKRGYRYYDLGGDNKNQGLRQFKSGMVERAGKITQLPGDFELCSSLRSLIGVKVGLQCREAYLATTRMVRSWRPQVSA
jgi:hypothetical protein